jgi:inward rectifier potassium channel
LADTSSKKPAHGRSQSPAFQFLVKGSQQSVWNDLYYFLLTARWRVVLLLVLGSFVFVNGAFAVAYMLTGVHGAQAGSFADAFFFSVQTLGTIGYGAMYPDSLGAHLVVSGEALFGLLSTAVITGLAFAKFSRPRARIIFSRHALISVRDGQPTLMVRIANERRNNIAEAQMRLSILRSEITAEGESLRRIIDLPLVRSQTPAFVMTWTVMHRITPDSPFYGATAEKLKEGNVMLIASVTGHDDTFAQTIHARHTFEWKDVLWNHRFADVILPAPAGVIPTVDYSLFHETVELPAHLHLPPG